jgi:hypothetical protein
MPVGHGLDGSSSPSNLLAFPVRFCAACPSMRMVAGAAAKRLDELCRYKHECSIRSHSLQTASRHYSSGKPNRLVQIRFVACRCCGSVSNKIRTKCHGVCILFAPKLHGFFELQIEANYFVVPSGQIANHLRGHSSSVWIWFGPAPPTTTEQNRRLGCCVNQRKQSEWGRP